MLADAASAVGVLRSRGLRANLRDMFAGTICSVLSIGYSLSYAALIFSGPLAGWLPYGIAMTFLSAAIAAAVVAWRSSLPFAVAGPDTSTSAVMATLVATFAAHLAAPGQDVPLMPILIAMGLATAITGTLLCVLGFTQAGRAVRFVPFPVMGGFLGATGWLMILGAVQVVADQRLAFASLAAFADLAIAMKLVAAIVVALALQVLVARSSSAFVLPGVLIAALVGIHVAMLVTGTPLADAQAAGWMFRPQPPATLTTPWQPSALWDFPWTALPWLAGDFVAVMFVTTVSLLLNITGIEIATKREADISRELKALGLASLASAASGGFVSCMSLSRTTLNHAAGATSCLSGFTLAAILAAMLIVDPGFLGYVPRFALGGLLFYAGGRLFHRWIVVAARQLPLVEYLSLVAIAVIIVEFGFIAGVLIGVVIGCSTFALSASRVNAVKFSFDGSEYRSSLDRGGDELALLARHGREIQGMALQSYLFFGSANRLYERVKELLAQRPDCRFLVFDFRLVTGLDSSASHSFSQIRDAARQCGAKVVLVNLSAEIEKTFRVAGFIAKDVVVVDDLDRALEMCEEAVISAHRRESGDERTLQSWLAQALGDGDLAQRLVDRCRRLDVAAGEVIARQGEPAASMHFVLEGRVGIVVAMDGRSVRVRSLGRQSTIGEMGLIARRPRSATIQAEVASVLYELPAEEYDRITREEPALSQALLSYVISVMAERLSFANRVIGVLQR